MTPGNLITRKVFKGNVDRLRRIHGVEEAQAYKYMQECGCSKCDGFGNGRPSTLHTLEKEIDEALSIAQDEAKGEAPDFSKARLLAVHPLDYFNHKIESIGSLGFETAECKDRLLARVVSEQCDVVKAVLNGESNAEQLAQVRELQSVLAEMESRLATESRLECRLMEVGHLTGRKVASR